jgi:isoleucyl-tRNA synthetase
MALVREIVSQGRSARVGSKLKVRQPLAKVEVILADRTHQAWLEEHSALIAEELNVKQVEFTQKADQYITYNVLPDLKRLGPRVGKRLPMLKQAIASANAAQLLATMESAGSATFVVDGEEISLDSHDLQVRLQAKPGWAAAQGKSCVVVLATELSDDLVAEGWAREIVHVLQTVRKDLDCQYTDRIAVGIVTDDPTVQGALQQFGDYIRGETLAAELTSEKIDGVASTEIKVSGIVLQVYVKVVKS